MWKMKIFCISWLSVGIAFILTSDRHRLVVAQETDYWTPILASLPGALMGAINLALVTQLSTSRSGLSSKFGLGKLFSGAAGDGGKMLFVGRHNIQVSNHKDKKTEESVDESVEYAEDDYMEDDYDNEDTNGDYDEYSEEEGEDVNNGYNGKYKKKKKYKVIKYKLVEEQEKGDNKEEEEYDDDKKVVKEVRHVLVYPPKYPDNSVHAMTVPHDQNDYKTLMVKNAMVAQYPRIHPNHMYLSDAQESKDNIVFQSAERHQLITTKQSAESEWTDPTSTLSTPLIESGFQPLLKVSQTSVIRDKEIVVSPTTEELQYGKRVNSDMKSKSEEKSSNKNVNYLTSEPQGYERIKRSLNGFDMNRVGNVPPLRFNRTSQKHVFQTRLTPEVVRLLLTGIHLNPQNQRYLADQPMASMEPTGRKKNRKSKRKRQRPRHRKRDNHKTSSNRVVKKTRMFAEERTRHPVKYVPLSQYKKILNFDANKKSDTNLEEEVSENDDDYYEDDYCDDECEEEEEEERDMESEKRHTTVQIIEKPDKKLNIGLSGWMRRMFRTKKGLFRRGSVEETEEQPNDRSLRS